MLKLSDRLFNKAYSLSLECNAQRFADLFVVRSEDTFAAEDSVESLLACDSAWDTDQLCHGAVATWDTKVK